jgi:asparagine synthase (glutamine-hydrolysing)
MCGIAGIWRQNPGPAAPVHAMAAALVHRGPDDAGTWDHPREGLTLGHRRLAILDTTSAGRQPMVSPSGRFRVVYNGEIYNFRELRGELEGLGHRFETRSDTEVLLVAWERWQERALDRLRGMFAFALWDEERTELVLARDRLGIKPLYYAWIGGTFLFASEVRALLASGLVPRVADRQSLWDYLSYGAVLEPRTIVRDVRALEAGHLLRIRHGRAVTERWWDLVEATASARALPEPAYDDAVSETRRLLEDATAHHLVADVPVGAFLSGGIDSTAVVGLASSICRQPIQTFSVGFGGEHGSLDELKWARTVADRFGCRHEEVVVTSAQVDGLLDEVAGALDQPSLDGTNTFIVSRAARQAVTVALSGLGGDELYAGYPHFARYARDSRLAPRGAGDTVRSLLRLASPALPGRVRLPLESATASPAERLASFRLLADERMKRQAVRPDFFDGFAPQAPVAVQDALLRPELDPIAQVSYTEVNGYLRNTLLRDADAMSMSHSLEIRPVLLDHELVEYTFALPAEHKISELRTKRVLVDAIEDLLPHEVVTRRKMGFELPLGPWVQGSLRDRAHELLESSSSTGLLSPDFRSRLGAAVDGHRPVGHRLWSIVMLLAYLEAHQLRVGA